MVRYVRLGGQDRPVCFSYAVAYEYERQTGKFYEQDVQTLAAQVIAAGAEHSTDDVASAARHISMVKFIDILHACLVVGYRKERMQVDFAPYDVADWLSEDRDTVTEFTAMLLEANFDLSGENQSDNDEGDTHEKKRTLGRKKSTGTNS